MDQDFDIETVRRDAEKGTAAAQYNLGVWHSRGADDGADPDQAKQFFELAAQQGFAPAQSALGYMLLRNRRSAGDVMRAAEWFEQAAQAGFADAQYRLGELHAVGDGVSQDSEKALNWFSQAAAQQNTRAMCQFAYCLEHGLGCERNMLAATKTWLAAADLGEPRALCAIGWRFEHGLTVEKDPDVASHFYRRAQESGYEPAHYALRRVGCVGRPPLQPIEPVANDDGPHECAIEVISEAPRIFWLRQLMSQDECYHLISSAMPFLQASRIIERGSGKIALSGGRRSGTARMAGPLRDVVVWNLEQRLARYAGLPVENAETLTILHYGPGDEYRPHHDYFDPAVPGRDAALKHGGQRIATLMTYLNDVEQGGETVFPEIGLQIKPEPGAGLLFFNVNKNGSLDPQTRHAGAPVQSGDKWIATRWIREREWTLAANAE